MAGPPTQTPPTTCREYFGEPFVITTHAGGNPKSSGTLAIALKD
jgi:hypothetical protein